MADDTQQPPQQQPPPDLNAAIQALIQQQLRLASGQGQQVQLPSAQPPPSQYSNDPSQGPDLLERIGLRLGGGALPGAPAQLQAQMGRQALLNFGIGLMSGGRFATPGEVLAGGLRGAQGGLLGSEAAQAGQQEYALNAQAKLAELGLAQQKNRTEALQAVVPLLQMQGRLGLPPLFGPGSSAGPPGGGPGGGVGGDTYEGAITAHEGTGQNPNSTAFGPGQFLASTWNQFAAANPDLFKGMTPEQILAARGNPAIANQAITWLAQQNAQTLQKQGITPTGQSLGMAHYLGAGGAAKVMGAPDSDLVSKYVSDAAVKANPELATMTVGQMKARYANTPAPGFLTAATGPPGSAPAAAPPANGKLPVPPVPPSTATPARAVGPFGVGAFAPPTTTVAAPPTTTASAPNVDTALPNVPTPAMTAAVAQARRTGKPALIEGANGAMVGPDGRFISNVGTLGKRADADAILQGVQTAQTTMPPAGVVAAAGPGAGGGTTPTPAQPAPDAAFGGGAFATAPPRAVGPIATAAATPPPPVAQPPTAQPQPPATPPTPPPAPARDIMARNPDGSFVIPDEKVTVPEYQARNRLPPTPDELVSRGLVLPQNVKAFQDQQTAVTNAERDAAAAADAANRAQTGYLPQAEVAKLIDAKNAADKNAQDARNTYNQMVQDAGKTNALALQNFYKDQDAQLASAHKDMLDRQAASALQAQQGQQKINEIIAQSGETQKNEAMKTVNANMIAASDRIDQLQLLRGLSENAGNASVLSSLHVGNKSLADIVSMTGFGSQQLQDKAAAVQAFRNGVLNVVRTLREGGAATGEPRSNQDLQFVLDMAPGEWQDPNTRSAIISYLQAVNQRHIDLGAEIGRLTQTYLPGTQTYMPFGQAVQEARGKMGDMVPQVPKEIMQADPAAQWKWFNDNNIKPYTFFRYPNGKMDLYRGPPAQ